MTMPQHTDDTSPIRVREATPEDAAAVHALTCVIAETLGLTDKVISTPDDLARDMRHDPPAFRALLAETPQPEAVGLALFFMDYSTWRGQYGIYVLDLAIAPDWQGRGLGRQLLSGAAALAHKAGCTYLKLAADRENERALGFYGRLGFTVADEEIVHHITGEAFVDLARQFEGSAT